MNLKKKQNKLDDETTIHLVDDQLQMTEKYTCDIYYILLHKFV